jgi:hypothetical protein
VKPVYGPDTYSVQAPCIGTYHYDIIQELEDRFSDMTNFGLFYLIFETADWSAVGNLAVRIICGRTAGYDSSHAALQFTDAQALEVGSRSHPECGASMLA